MTDKNGSKVVRAKRGRPAKAGLPSNGLELTNHMRCPWIVPPEIMKGKTRKNVSDIDERKKLFSRKQKIVAPNETIVVDADGFKDYYGKSVAFQAMVDNKHIVASNKKVPVEMLRSVAPVKAPLELQNVSDDHTALATDSSDITQQMKGLTPIGH